MPDRGDILIVGGGIIGCACADELARRGAKVTLIDKGEIGHGCSYGNAGWVTPCFAMPLPMPGMLLKSIQWILDPDGPLYIKPRLSWELVRWLARFSSAMNHRQLRASTAALAGLAKYSLEAYRALDAEKPGSFGFAQKGLLMVTQTAAGYDAARAELTLMAPHGIPGRTLTADEVRTLEPTVTGETRGGVFFTNEAHVEPLAAVNALAARAAAHGAKFIPDTEVFEFIRTGKRITGVRTTRGTMRADQVVLAAGSWSNSLARSLRLRVPILAGKGYAVIVEPFEPAPTRPLMLLEKKIAVTPRANSVRLSGTLELVGLDETITARRVEAIVRGSRQFVNVPEQPKIIEVWRGLRPCTPDGVPIIGRPAGFENLVVVAGHQMIGLLTAPGTARLAADLIIGGNPVFDPHPFRATRF